MPTEPAFDRPRLPIGAQSIAAAPIAAPPFAPTTPGRAHWTPAKQRIFLVALLDTGSVAAAARAAGMSASSAHRLRARLADTPFAAAWRQALAEHRRRLADPFARPAVSPSAASPPAAPGPRRR